jgi:hypothetical protein
MEGTSVHAVELVFLLLLLFVVVFASLARKLQLPYPIVLVKITPMLCPFLDSSSVSSATPPCAYATKAASTTKFSASSNANSTSTKPASTLRPTTNSSEAGLIYSEAAAR